ncbi:hypothetical protein LOAG_07111 [Loa loa]|uniref:Uncharacterized protein n=2 Tax=Loa loa TaxID=7209 RepID=A0A1S0TWM2_LOALO|nr:hypothetical protein LOAG_07111 [Loa loa]EFO21380.1 hypothetical protein LOAG_07111 [Loa loa]
MLNTIIKDAQPAKRKLADLLDEAKAVNLTPPDQHLSVDKKQQQFELKRRTIEEKIRRLKVYVGTLGSINEKATKSEDAVDGDVRLKLIMELSGCLFGIELSD